MGIVADMMSRMEVRAISLDKNIQAKLTKGGTLDVTFRSGAYDKYSDQGLTAQLSGLLTRLGDGYRTAMDKVVEADMGAPPDRKREEWDAHRRRYLAERRDIEARGVGPKKCIRTKLHNMSTWTAEVKPGTRSTLTEKQLTAEIVGAVSATLGDYSRQQHKLRRKYGMTFHRDSMV